MRAKGGNIISCPSVGRMLRWRAIETGGKIEVNIDNGSKLFRGGVSHGFKNALVNENTQAEYILTQLFG